MKLDCNALVGTWPFRKIRDNTFEAIKAKHEKNGVRGGFISSANAIFYNDPMEGDLDLAKELEAHTNYRQVITVNPMLPGTCANIRRAVRELDPAGVKIYPHFHMFDLHDPKVEEMCEVLKEYKLPLFLNLRMDDARAEYMLLSKPVDIWGVLGFIQRHRDFPIIICNARVSEFRYFAQGLPCYDNVAVDMGNLKIPPYGLDELYKEGLTKFLVYSSNAPIYSLRSTMIQLEKAGIPEAEKQKIFGGDYFINAIDPKYRPVIK